MCVDMRVRVLAYNCMHACVGACMCVNVHKRVCIVCTCKYLCVFACVSVHTGVRARMCAYVSACGGYVLDNVCAVFVLASFPP